MTHLAIEEQPEGEPIVFHEQVTDEEYSGQSAPAPKNRQRR
jgi:hypothetical protein